MLISHWCKLIEGLQASPLDFYKCIEEAIERRKIPGLDRTHVLWPEGGLLSAKRDYLRLSREKLLFDVCAAPFGTGFFVSCRLVDKEFPWHLFIAAILLVVFVFFCLWLLMMMAVKGILAAFASIVVLVPTFVVAAVAVWIVQRFFRGVLLDIDRVLITAPILINGGPIGGVKQSGKWGLDARFTKATLKDRVARIAAYRERIAISNLDAIEFIQTLVKKYGDRQLFIYLDPPYYEKGSDLYMSTYKHEDHQAVGKAIMELKHPHWVMTYDDVPAIRAIYKSCQLRSFRLRYTAQQRRDGDEVFIVPRNIVLPRRLLIAFSGALSLRQAM